MSDLHGKFVWYELMTTDTKAALSFYRDVMGWGARTSNATGIEYTELTVGDVPIGGLMAIPQEAREAGGRPGWMGYVAVDDVDASAAQAKEAGGTVHRPPADIPGVGRFAIISDPQGAMVALFKGAAEIQGEADAPEAPGRAGWRELLATDWESAFDFYAKLFGWTKAEAVDMGPMGAYQLFAAGGQPIGGMMNRPPQMPAPFWIYYFMADSIDAAMKRVSDSGGQVINGPMEVPGGSWIAQCLDPQGAIFALVSPRR